MSKIGRCFLLLLLCSPLAWAELEFFQSADKTTIGLEETFQLSIVVSDAPPNAQLQLPSSNDFEILSRSQSTQLQYRTGSNLQKEQRYLFILRAKKEGQLLIPAALLKTEKNTYRTETIAIHVVPSQATPSPSFQKNTPPTTPRLPRADSDLFIQMSLDKSSAYVGEQVLLSLQAYSKTTNIHIESLSMPTLKGFLSEDIELSWPLLTEHKLVNGANYYVTTIKKRALFAIQSGNYTVEPAMADFAIGGLFKVREARRESNALTLEILPLPPSAENLPVGQWKLELKIPQTPLVAGQPVEIDLVLQGNGNIKNLPPLELQFPNTFKTFPPTVQTHTQILNNKLIGSRTIHHVAIPKEAGTFTIPATKFNYFNAETATVASSQTHPLSLIVLPNSSENTPTHIPAPHTTTPPPEQKTFPIRHQA
ncbi:MAG: BatD family protein, partial [Cystobacterineae bacterium]|nr:BatD family protein [Cystobacterineae bacterium]